jgi:NADH-quinone oxidoreductase subunit A
VFKEYIYIFLFIIFLFVLTFLLIYLNYLLIQHKPNIEKDSSYECGFQAFDVIIDRFDIKYYIVALLFLIFDLELIFLLP